MNVDKRILEELRRECLEVERGGEPEGLDHTLELPPEARALFDSVVAFATDDDVAQIDAFFATTEHGDDQMSPAKDLQIKRSIRRASALRANQGDSLGFRPAVAFRSSQRVDDEQTRKAISDFAKELWEEDAED